MDDGDGGAISTSLEKKSSWGPNVADTQGLRPDLNPACSKEAAIRLKRESEIF
jgi:hypothetical protein